MYFIYSVLLALGLIALLPRFLLDALRHGKYIEGIRERLGFIASSKNDGEPVVWLHCVSVGETQAARPIIQAIRRQLPHYRIAISTVTITGQQVAREILKNEADRVFYFPIDWRWTVRRTLRAINPAVVLIMETELWPNFLKECASAEIPVAVVNGRLSERSFRRYQLISSFVSRVVNCLDRAVMQTDADANRIKALGLPPEKVIVSGSVKFDAGAITETNELTEQLSQRFELGGSFVILAASTHDPEEQIALAAFARIKADFPAVRLIIAPRHPERFGEIAALVNASGLKWARRSAAPSATEPSVEVILLDTIGELKAVFPLASIVFVGGSIASSGGHNVIEPAAAGACIVTGAHTENFQEIVNEFVAADAIVQLPLLTEAIAAPHLAEVFSELLRDEQRRQNLGVRAHALIAKNSGATARTMTALTELFSQNREAGRSISSITTTENIRPA